MKTTIDIPDDLYRRVKAECALRGKRIRELTIELYRRWLQEGLREAEAARPSAEAWLDEWIRLGEEALRNSPEAPTATEILAEDRDRLERR